MWPRLPNSLLFVITLEQDGLSRWLNQNTPSRKMGILKRRFDVVTTRDTNSWIRLLVTGIIAGMIAGAVMAMYAMIASVTFLGQGFFTPLYAIAAPLVGQQSLMSSMHGGAFYFTLGPAVLGLVVHMMWSALYGVIFGLIALWTHLRGLVAVIGGMIYGVLAMLFMSFIVLPIVGMGSMPSMVGWTSFTIQHLMFGLVIGLWPVLRPQDFTGLISRSVRQTV